MTERLGSGDRQKGLARVVLALLVGILGLLTVFGPTASLLTALAQQASPTATTTDRPGGDTSPAPAGTPTGTQIQLVNPSKYTPREVVSIQPDANETYHLVAWVSAVPSDAVVEFQLRGGSDPNFRHIGTATRVGADTFEFQWNLSYGDAQGGGVQDGEYTLRARLFSRAGGSPTGSPTSPSPSGSPSPSPSEPVTIAFDDEEVVVEREAEALEIIDPVNGGQVGHYDPDGEGPRRPGFTMRVVASAGTDDVMAFYSTARPGAEPHWTECEEQITVSFDDRSRTIGCTVNEDDGENPLEDLTAVAAVTVDDVPGEPTPTPCPPVVCDPEPAGEVTESGDAHRAFPYDADPSVVSLTDAPATSPRNSCQELTATVLDQANRPVWRANVDVHATGPDDNLQFAVTERTSPFQAPDQGSHETEDAWDCEDDDDSTSQNQGVHPRQQPNPDTHHIESRATPGAPGDPPRNEPANQEGTDFEGRFVFALRSRVVGTTQVAAWADEDDDDLRDNPTTGPSPGTVDPEDTTTITWSTQSPTPESTATGTTASGTSPSASTPSGSTPSASTPSATSSGPTGTLNCEPETRTNATNTSHTITCTVNQPGSRSGVAVDVELTGANDADGDTRNTPDRECTTNESGVCTFRHGPGGFGRTTDPGTTVYRAWIDADDNDASREDDPTEGVNEFQQPGQNPDEPDNTDVVEKTWQQAPLDCFPEQDGNPTGASHTVTCRAFQTGGAPQPQGTRIVAEATGANDPDGTSSFETPDFECRTNQAGECSFIHGPAPGGRGTTNQEGLTRYHAWIDVDDSNSTPEVDQGEGRDDSDADQTDVVEKTWTRNPTALTIEPESDSASVGTCNAFTITVTGDNRPVSGVFVDVEQRHDRANNQTNNDEPRVTFCTPGGGDGPNPSAVDQTQGDLDPPDENPDNPGTLGGETLTATDSDGRVTIGIAVEPANGSDGTGNVTVTAFFETDDDNDPEAGEPQDTSTKTWVSPEARTIVCQPESASNPVNTQHTVTCTVRDRFGAPVQGKGVTFTEDGPGDFTSRGTSTDGNGQVRAVTTSGQGGTQTITATIDDDLQGGEPGEVDDCDRGAGSPPGAPVGACSDSVTKTWVPTTTSPTQFERDVTIEAQKSRLVFGKNVTLGGTVESDAAAPAACTQFVSVDILRDVVGGASEFRQFASVQSDSDGAFSYDFRADVSANYVAQVEEVAQCGAATSDAEPVLVKVKVGLRLSDSSVRRGQRVRFTVQTRPCPATARDRVLLFRAIDGEFGKVGSKRTNDRCVKSFRRRVETDSVFQSRWPKQAEEFLAGKSRPKIVRIVGRRR